MSFDNLLDKAAEFLKANDRITIIAHSDADGLCATAILTRLCEHLGIAQETVFLEQVSAGALAKLATDDPVVFVDMGSSHLAQIEERFPDAIILDHHQAQGAATGLLLVNPTLEGMDGTREACAASIAWHLAQRLMDATPLSQIALIGIQADNQPFVGLNATVLIAAKVNGLVRVEDGARVHGRTRKPLVALLAGSYDLAVQGVTRNPRGAARLLDELGIPEREQGRQRMYDDLTLDEKRRLDDALVRRSPHPEALVAHCTLTGMKGALADTREAATLVNACGRSGIPEIGVKALLGNDPELAERAREEYQQEVRKAHDWAARSDDVLREDGLVLIRGGTRIPAAVAGALCSVLVRGREVPEDTVVICLARNADGTTKVSGRTAGRTDLAALIGGVARDVGGEGGGHAVAAGANIPTEQEDAFVEGILEKLSL